MNLPANEQALLDHSAWRAMMDAGEAKEGDPRYYRIVLTLDQYFTLRSLLQKGAASNLHIFDLVTGEEFTRGSNPWGTPETAIEVMQKTAETQSPAFGILHSMQLEGHKEACLVQEVPWGEIRFDQ